MLAAVFEHAGGAAQNAGARRRRRSGPPHLRFTHAYRASYELWGERGRIVLERAFTPTAGWQPVLRLEQQDRVELRTLPAEDHFRGALDAFLAAVRGRQDPTGHGERTLAGLALLDAVRDAADPPAG